MAEYGYFPGYGMIILQENFLGNDDYPEDLPDRKCIRNCSCGEQFEIKLDGLSDDVIAICGNCETILRFKSLNDMVKEIGNGKEATATIF